MVGRSLAARSSLSNSASVDVGTATITGRRVGVGLNVGFPGNDGLAVGGVKIVGRCVMPGGNLVGWLVGYPERGGPLLELLLVDAVRLLPEMTMYSTRPSMTTILRVVKA
jgi:hypothetical protein